MRGMDGKGWNETGLEGPGLGRAELDGTRPVDGTGLDGIRPDEASFSFIETSSFS